MDPDKSRPILYINVTGMLMQGWSIIESILTFYIPYILTLSTSWHFLPPDPELRQVMSRLNTMWGRTVSSFDDYDDVLDEMEMIKYLFNRNAEDLDKMCRRSCQDYGSKSEGCTLVVVASLGDNDRAICWWVWSTSLCYPVIFSGFCYMSSIAHIHPSLTFIQEFVPWGRSW